MSNTLSRSTATASEQVEPAPLPAEELFRSLLEQLPVGAYTCDVDGRITFFNARMAELWGRTPRLCDDAERFCGSHRILTMEGFEIPREECWMAEVLRNGTEESGREVVIVRPDGSSVPVIAHPRALHDVDGKLVGAVNVLVDITERKRAEDALREREAAVREEARLVATLQRIGQALTSELALERLVQAITDAATELTGAGFGALFYGGVDESGEGYGHYTLSGLPREAFDGYPPPHDTGVFAPTFLGVDVVRSDDITRDPRYGQSPPHFGIPPDHPPVRSYLAVPVVSRTGEALGGLVFGHEDVGVFTEKHERLAQGIAGWAAVAIDNASLYEAERRARDEAVEANRAKTDFLAVMSHELRTPLNAIIGYGDLLLAEVAGPVAERQREYLERMRAAAWHQLDLVDRILSLSRIEARDEAVERRKVDVVELTREAIALIRPQAGAKGLDVEFHASAAAVQIVTDPPKLRQILINLLANAVKFTPDGKVEARIETDPSAVSIQVRDTGVGIAAADRKRIFEPFTQIGSSSQRAGGAGLGLAICQRLARLLGGEILLESEPGQGSTFTVRLPASAPADPHG